MKDNSRLFRNTLLVLCAIGAAAVIRRLLVLQAGTAAASGRGADLDLHFGSEDGVLLLHLVPSLLFVALLPLQFVDSLRRRRPGFHRWTGRVVVLCGAVLGISALRLSMHPVGGLLEASATTLFGCLFLFALGKAWWHIRHRRVELHRQWATRMAAIALGVATTRPIMGVFFATSRLTGLTPQQFFGPAMWIGFTLTVAAGEVWIRRGRAAEVRLSESPRRNMTADVR